MPQPNQKWVTDVTEFNLFGEKLYLSDSRFAQQRSGQLYYIGSSCAQHGDDHAERRHLQKFRTEQTSFSILTKAVSTNTNNTNRCSGRKVFARA